MLFAKCTSSCEASYAFRKISLEKSKLNLYSIRNVDNEKSSLNVKQEPVSEDSNFKLLEELHYYY